MQEKFGSISLSRHARVIGISLLACFLLSSTALSQSYPSKPLRLILGFPPGGAEDTVARILANKYSEALGQPVVVENKPGANATIGATAAAKSAPDGYTLFMGGSTELTVAPTVMSDRLQYVVERDFTPLGMVVTAPNMLVVLASSNINTVNDLVAQAKAHPSKLNFATFGGATTSYMAAETLQKASGTSLTHIPFKGSAPAITELLAGRVDMFFDTAASAMSHVKTGKLRALAVTSAKRMPLFPNVPTMQELGFNNFVFGSSLGILVPVGTPPAIVERLQAETVRIMALPDIRQRFTDLGLIPQNLGASEYSSFLKTETARSAKIIRESNMTFD